MTNSICMHNIIKQIAQKQQSITQIEIFTNIHVNVHKNIYMLNRLPHFYNTIHRLI